MLSLSNIQITAENDILLPDCGGVELHGLFFSLLSGIDAELATRLHDKAGLKPYSIGGLRGGGLNDGRLLLRSGERATFSLGLLTGELVRAGEKLAAELENGKKVNLGRGEATISVRGRAYHQNWSRLIPVKSRRTINLRLVTPLAFKTGRVNLPLPEPVRLLKSLARNWMEFADRPLELPEGAVERVRLSRCELHTELRRLGRRYFVGAVGNLTLELPKHGGRELAALLRLAEFCGAGSKTTMGMGEIEIERKPRSGK